MTALPGAGALYQLEVGAGGCCSCRCEVASDLHGQIFPGNSE